jgi:tripartite-type tricarboxylate transporter receptor subunit TctC
MNRILQAVLRAAACGALTAATASAAYASFPDQPVKLVVPYPPGGSTDVIARVVAGKLSERLKQSVVVENRAGASGMIGSEYVGRAAPNGYTLVFTAADTHSINPHVYAKMRYDAKKDFVPVGLVGYLTMALIVHPAKAPGNLAQFVDMIKAKPGTISYASWGIGSSSQVAMEMFRGIGKLDMLHVPFQGAAPAITAVIAGHVDSMMVPMTLAEPNHRSGKVKLLGVAAPNRMPWATDLPTLAEQGMAVDGRLWLGILAPAKTPADVIAVLNRELNAALSDPAVKETMLKNGLEGATGSAQDFGKLLDSQYDRWGASIRAANIRLND